MYGGSKLAGAGWATVWFVFVYAIAEFPNRLPTMYDLSMFLQQPFSVWTLYYMYGLIAAICIDLLVDVVLRLQRARYVAKAVLYMLAGMLYFLAGGQFGSEYVLLAWLAAGVGALSALTFWWGTVLAERSKLFMVLCALGVPLLVGIVSQVDFTVRTGWQETGGEGRYEVRYDKFHGHQAIDVKPRTDRKVEVTIEHRAESGGPGYYIRDRAGRYVGMVPNGSTGAARDSSAFTFEARAGETYQIIITATHMSKGHLIVSWH